MLPNWLKRKKSRVYRVRALDQIEIEVNAGDVPVRLVLTEINFDYHQGTTAIFTDLTRFLQERRLTP